MRATVTAGLQPGVKTIINYCLPTCFRLQLRSAELESERVIKQHQALLALVLVNAELNGD